MLWKKIVALTLLLAVCLLTSCGGKYVCITVESNIVYHHNAPSEPLTEITIGEHTDAVEWQDAVQNDFTGKISDKYLVNTSPPDSTSDSESENKARIYPRLRIERESGNIVSFQQLTAFPLTGEITFDSLQQVIEAHFPYTDFDAFDTKTAREDNYSTVSVKNGTYYIWKKANENVSLTVYVDKNGMLCDLSYANAPAAEEKLVIEDGERDKLIEKALKKTSLWENGMTFTAELLYYTQYRGENAVVYQVHLADKTGFSHGVTPIIIHE